MRVTIKGLKAEVQNLEAELKSAAHRLRHVERELLASQIDLRPGDDRAGAPEPITDQVAQAALDATLRAEGEWELDVTEPGLGGAHGADRINVYISGSDGLQWPDANMKKDGANPYEKNGDFAWCGAFAAYCWAILKPSIRK
ncbi:MAG: hypothetical protein ACO39X_07700, partial [Candidatus Nanopelagicaceae bacterium]